ncbi:MAG: GldG family protein [Chthonomonadales bacterium]
MEGMSANPRVATLWLWAAGAGLILGSLVRWSVYAVWDVLCTVLFCAGAAGVVGWMAARRTVLVKSARARGVRFGTQTAVSAVLLAAILSGVNFVASRHNIRWDFTQEHLFTLSPQTRKVLHSLPVRVRLMAFFPSSRRAQAADLLRRYADESPLLQYQMIDPDEDPEAAKKYGVTQYGSVVVEALGEASGRTRKPLIVEAESTGGRNLTLSEEKLTNALVKVTRTGERVLYFLQGHGEGDPDSTELNGYSRVKQALEDQGYTVKPLLLARVRKVPEDCAALIIAGPSQELLPAETAVVQGYLQRAGRLLVLVDPPPAASLATLLGKWAIRPLAQQILDPSAGARMYGARPEMPLVTEYDARQPITRDFRLPTIFPLVRPVVPMDQPGDASVLPLAQTSASSVAIARGGDRKASGVVRTRRGPFVIAVTSTRQTRDGREARVVAIGSSNFVSNSFFDKAGNGDFFLNCVNWLAEQEALISIRPRTLQDHRVSLTDEQARWLRVWFVFVMPAGAIAAGAIVLWRRR